jgi:hypothetical protein
LGYLDEPVVGVEERFAFEFIAVPSVITERLDRVLQLGIRKSFRFASLQRLQFRQFGDVGFDEIR